MTRITHDPATDPAPGIDPIKTVFTLIAALFFALSPLLQGGFAGYDPAAFPVPQIDPPAQPAGYAFAIWGLIYAWLLAMGFYGMFKRGQDAGWEATRLPLILSMAPGAAWIGVAKTSPVMATVLIFWMLGTALWALGLTPRRDRWWLQAPVAVYAGWLTAASFVSLALIGAGWGVLFGATGWALVALAGALGTGLWVQERLARAPEYGAALVWALIAVAVANVPGNLVVALAALAGAAVMGLKAAALRGM